MDYKIISPIMLWQDYNPTRQPLEVTILNMEVRGNLLIKEVVFTAETVADGKIRAYAKLILQRGEEKAPTFLYIPSALEPVEKGVFSEEIFKKGYNMVVIDFGGEAEGKTYFTTYPDSLAYCNCAKNKDNIFKPTIAENSPWYTWMKVIRRAVTLVCEEQNVDREKIILLGITEGAQLAWSVAGIDGRIKAVIPVGASGYVEYFNKPKYAPDSVIELTDTLECWLAGISTQAYARMVMCPVLYLTGTNSVFSDIDRVNDLFALVPSKYKYLHFSPNTNQNISLAGFQSAMVWLEYFLNGRGKEVVSPKLDTYVSEGKLYASVKSINNYDKAEVYYATDEIYPAFRSWHLADGLMKVGDDECIVPISPYKETANLFVFATVTYANGISLSTQEIALNLKNLNITEFKSNLKTKSRFIYNSDMLTSTMSVETQYPIVDQSLMYMGKGASDIVGLGITKGKLCIYNIEPPEDRTDGTWIIQMDIYSEVAKDIVINAYTDEKGIVQYHHTISLLGSQKWQRVNLTCADFKTDDMRQLKDWSHVKKMKIINANNVLFNKMLWL